MYDGPFDGIIYNEVTAGQTMKRILVIDDEDYISDVLSLLLLELGYSVESLPSAELALQRVYGPPYFAVFCDLNMPGIDGIEFFDRLITMMPDLRDRFVLLTGIIFDSKTERLIRERGIKTIIKPFGFEDIRNLLVTLERGGFKG